MAILECKGLCKSYGAEPALDRVDLTVEPGHIVGLLGPNGSGKSTLIKLANGLLTPDAGEILIDGMAPGKETKKIVSYLPERTYFADWMTALQLLAFFGDFYDDFDRDAAVQMMQRLGIQPKQQIKQMSKGTREKVQLILVMSARRSSTCLTSRSAVSTQRRAISSSIPSSATTIQRPPSLSRRT